MTFEKSRSSNTKYCMRNDWEYNIVFCCIHLLLTILIGIFVGKTYYVDIKTFIMALKTQIGVLSRYHQIICVLFIPIVVTDISISLDNIMAD